MKPILKVVIFAAVLVTAFGVGFGWRDLRAGTVPSADAFKKLANRRITDPVEVAKGMQFPFRYWAAHNASRNGSQSSKAKLP